jgi:putative transcriptional regulator
VATKREFDRPLLRSVHETVRGLQRAGLVDKQTMKSFDRLCLTPVKGLTADQIQKIRKREKVSQAVFASHLNVTTGLVSQWERGLKHPSGPALKLLTLVARKGLQSVA